MMHEKFCLFIIALVLISCNEEIKTSIVQGRLIESCGAESLVETEVILVESKAQKVIASSTTDGEGNFVHTYEMEEDIDGTAVLKYFDGAIFNQVMSGIPLNQSLDLLAMKNYSSNLNITVASNGVFGQDTLMFSINGSEKIHQFISPKTGDSQQLSIPLPSSYVNSSNKILYWGMGLIDYRKAKSSLDTSSPYHQLNFAASTCGESNLTIQI